MEIIALDSHKHYSVASVQTPDGHCLAGRRIEHQRGSIREFLQPYSPGSPAAVETIGNWYWIVDEIEAAGMVPQLVHARKAKLMLGSINRSRACAPALCPPDGRSVPSSVGQIFSATWRCSGVFFLSLRRLVVIAAILHPARLGRKARGTRMGRLARGGSPQNFRKALASIVAPHGRYSPIIQGPATNLRLSRMFLATI
jgi:hypothetical protein